jgi:hypothetical protein
MDGLENHAKWSMVLMILSTAYDPAIASLNDNVEFRTMTP